MLRQCILLLWVLSSVWCTLTYCTLFCAIFSVCHVVSHLIATIRWHILSPCGSKAYPPTGPKAPPSYFPRRPSPAPSPSPLAEGRPSPCTEDPPLLCPFRRVQKARNSPAGRPLWAKGLPLPAGRRLTPFPFPTTTFPLGELGLGEIGQNLCKCSRGEDFLSVVIFGLGPWPRDVLEDKF